MLKYIAHLMKVGVVTQLTLQGVALGEVVVVVEAVVMLIPVLK